MEKETAAHCEKLGFTFRAPTQAPSLRPLLASVQLPRASYEWSLPNCLCSPNPWRSIKIPMPSQENHRGAPPVSHLALADLAWGTLTQSASLLLLLSLLLHCVRKQAELTCSGAFIGREGEAGESQARVTMATALRSKGKGTFMERRVVALMCEIAWEQMDAVVKSDQGAAMKAIMTEVGRVRAAAGASRMIVEASPMGQPEQRSSGARVMLDRGADSE